MTKRKEILISFLFIISLVLPIIAFSKDEEACRHLEVPIPGLTSTCLPALPDYIVAIYNFALMIIGIICFGALLYGGFRYLISAGNPTVMADARDQIFSAILGLIILFSSYLILTTIILFNFDVLLENLSTNNDTGGIRGTYLSIKNSAWVVAPILTGFVLTMYPFVFNFLKKCSRSFFAFTKPLIVCVGCLSKNVFFEIIPPKK